jgi:hypothetical protein
MPTPLMREAAPAPSDRSLIALAGVAVRCEALGMVYGHGSTAVRALRGVDLVIDARPRAAEPDLWPDGRVTASKRDARRDADLEPGC